VYQQRLLPPVDKAFQFAWQAEIASLLFRQSADGVNRNRTDLHAFGFAFAAIAIDHGDKDPRIVLAVFI
jgi:hypothetical protein